MKRQGIADLVDEALRGSDPRTGSLLDYHDLQAMLGRLALATQELLRQEEGLTLRLSRTPPPLSRAANLFDA